MTAVSCFVDDVVPVVARWPNDEFKTLATFHRSELEAADAEFELWNELPEFQKRFVDEPGFSLETERAFRASFLEAVQFVLGCVRQQHGDEDAHDELFVEMLIAFQNRREHRRESMLGEHCPHWVLGHELEAAKLRGKHHALTTATELFENVADKESLEVVLARWLESLDDWLHGPLDESPPPSKLNCDANSLAAWVARRRENDLLKSAPRFLRDVVAFNLRTAHRVQPWLALGGAIALQAVLCGRRIRDEKDGRTNLQIISIAPSATGKEHARSVNSMILDAADLIELEGAEDFTSGAAIAKALEKSPATLAQVDEIGRVIAACSDARAPAHLRELITVLMKLRTSGHRRRWQAKSYVDQRNNVEVDQPCLVLFGTTVPGRLFEALSGDDVLDGFLGRLLCFFGDAAPPKPNHRRRIDMTVPENIVDHARHWGTFSPPGAGNLDWIHPDPLIVRYSPDALEHSIEWFERWDARAAADPEFAPVWARTGQQAGALALVAFAARGVPVSEDATIEVADVDWSFQLADYLVTRFIEVAKDHVANGADDRLRKTILKLVRDRGGISHSDLLRAVRRSSRDVKEAIQWLTETGEITVERLPPGPRGGAPGHLYRVSKK